MVYPGGHRKAAAKDSTSETPRSSRNVASVPSQRVESPERHAESRPAPANPNRKEPSHFDTLTRNRLDALVDELDMIHGTNEEPAPKLKAHPLSRGSEVEQRWEVPDAETACAEPTSRRNFSEHSTSSSAYPSDIDFVDEDGLRPRDQHSSERSLDASPPLPAPQPPRFSFEPSIPTSNATGRNIGASSYSATTSSGKSGVENQGSRGTKMGFISGGRAPIPSQKPPIKRCFTPQSARDYQTRQEPWQADDLGDFSEELDEFGLPGRRTDHYPTSNRSQDWQGHPNVSVPGSNRNWENSNAGDHWSTGEEEYSPVLPIRNSEGISNAAENRPESNSTQDNIHVMLESLSELFQALPSLLSLT